MVGGGWRCGGALLRVVEQSVVALTTRRGVVQGYRKFYKTVTVAGTPGCYEVNLDHRKLKTPMGTVIQLPSYPLALAVAGEWSAVKDTIVPAFMHFTALSNRVVDYPGGVDAKWAAANAILNFLPTDTILYSSDESPEEFLAAQEQEWWPVLEWFNDRYGVQVKTSRSLEVAKITEETAAVVRRHILSYDYWALAGLMYGVETLKSLILTLAAAERRLTVTEAVRLSTLESNIQTEQWGRVEWGHDMELRDSEARFSAALLFFHLCSATHHTSATKAIRHPSDAPSL